MSKTLRFWLVLALQVVLVLAVPAQAFYTQMHGRSVVLQTRPVDPYSLFQGYSVTLSYEVSDIGAIEKIPGGKALVTQWKNPAASRDTRRNPGQSFYLLLEAPADVTKRPPLAWKAVRILTEYPDKLQANQVVLRGTHQSGRIAYGLETYFMPEDQRDRINDEIRQVQGELPAGSKPAFVVEVKVGSGGNGIPIAIWLKDKRYEF
jgi:uncharacterized membrane-anchored protein